jgi:uncharacterized RDD family membrane protein YckC
MSQAFVELNSRRDSRDVLNMRIGAALVDYFIYAITVVICFILFSEKADVGYTINLTALLVPAAIWFIYFVVIEKLYSGTPGHRWLGLKVVSLSGETPGFSQVLKRRLCDPVDFWCCFGVIGMLLSRYTSHNQRLGDLWAETIVVKR